MLSQPCYELKELLLWRNCPINAHHTKLHTQYSVQWRAIGLDGQITDRKCRLRTDRTTMGRHQGSRCFSAKLRQNKEFFIWTRAPAFRTPEDDTPSSSQHLCLQDSYGAFTALPSLPAVASSFSALIRAASETGCRGTSVFSPALDPLEIHCFVVSA